MPLSTLSSWCPRLHLRAGPHCRLRRPYAGVLAISTQWFSRPHCRAHAHHTRMPLPPCIRRHTRSYPCRHRGRTGILTITVRTIYVGEEVSVLVIAVVDIG